MTKNALGVLLRRFLHASSLKSNRPAMIVIQRLQHTSLSPPGNRECIQPNWLVGHRGRRDALKTPAVCQKPYFTLWKPPSWKTARIRSRALELEEHFRAIGYARNAPYGGSQLTDYRRPA